MDEVRIVTKWTSELNEKELDDYIRVYYLSLGTENVEVEWDIAILQFQVSGWVGWV